MNEDLFDRELEAFEDDNNKEMGVFFKSVLADLKNLSSESLKKLREEN